AGAVALEGELDAAALAQALWRVQARHEALRTRFGVDGQGQPVQVIDGPDSALAWHTEDLSGLAGEAQDAALQASLGSEASAPFDLERGPLLRARLMRLGEGHHVLSLCMHHIISDGWSIGVLLDELSTQYGACVAGEDDPLPALAVQYADYAAWQRQWLSGGALAAQQAYWQATLSERPRLLSLPLDHARPAQQDYRGDTVPVWLPEALTQRLQALAQREGVTLYMVLLASWGVLLG
ncbi:condensation domain-containing protein, partial [Thauera sinica]